MYTGINMITNEGHWFKLTNSMSFGEYVFSAGFIQKTIKVDLDIRVNRAYLQWDGHQKDLEDSRGLHTEGGHKRKTGGAVQPHLQADRPPGPPASPLLRMSVLYHLRVCIYAILLSQFDPRVQNWRYPLYIQPYTPSSRAILKP